MKKEKEITLLPRKKIVPKIPATLFEKALVVVLICSIVAWVGQIYYKKNLEADLENLTSQIEEVELKRDKDLEGKIYLAGERLGTLKNLVDSHLYWTKVFEKLEETTVPTVWFSDFKGQDLGQMHLDGFAADFLSLARQFVSLVQDETFKEVKLSSIGKGEAGEIGFTFELSFDPKLLLK